MTCTNGSETGVSLKNWTVEPWTLRTPARVRNSSEWAAKRILVKACGGLQMRKLK